MHTKKIPLFDKNGNPSHLLGISEDITERKKSEKTILEKSNELERINQFAVGRELKMIELKKEINSLLEKMGEKTKYDA